MKKFLITNFLYADDAEIVTHFISEMQKVLGSTLTKDGFLDAEIKRRISKASAVCGRLDKRVWSDKDLTMNTKLAVYKTCVLTTLLFVSKTWTPCRSQLKLLDHFQQLCLRHTLHIKWQSYTLDTKLQSKTNTVSISAMILNN